MRRDKSLGNRAKTSHLPTWEGYERKGRDRKKGAPSLFKLKSGKCNGNDFFVSQSLCHSSAV